MAVQAPIPMTTEEMALVDQCATLMLHTLQLDSVTKLNEFGKLIIQFKSEKGSGAGEIASDIAEAVNALISRELVYGRIYSETEQLLGLTSCLEDFIPGTRTGVDLASNATFTLGHTEKDICVNILLPQRFSPREWAVKFLQIATERAYGNEEMLEAVQALKAEVNAFDWPSEKQAADRVNRESAASMAEDYFSWKIRRAFPAAQQAKANYALSYDPPALFIYFLTKPDNFSKVQQFAESAQALLEPAYVDYGIEYVNDYDNAQLQMKIEMEPEELLATIKERDGAGFRAAMTLKQFEQSRR